MKLKISSVSEAGCANKVRASELLAVLSPNHTENATVDFALLSGDVGLIGKNLVSSVDAIMPVSEDPFKSGRIAVIHAANDIFAAAAIPIAACVCFMIENSISETDAFRELVNGVRSELRIQGTSLSKAHSVYSKATIISITYLGSRFTHLPSIAHDQEYDLLLTKPLGGALLNFAGIQLGRKEYVLNAEAVLLHSHRDVVTPEIMASVHFMTDVSGFGLAGQLGILAASTGRDIYVDTARIPIIAPVHDLLLHMRIPCAASRNSEDFASCVVFADSISKSTRSLCLNAETSGPLILGVPTSRNGSLLERLQEAGYREATKIGVLTTSRDGKVYFR